MAKDFEPCRFHGTSEKISVAMKFSDEVLTLTKHPVGLN